jgi:uncharacterized Zn finger protein (UPF0148 family)
MSTTYEIKCAKCKVPVKGPVDAKAETTVSCPVCGISDTLENVEREAADYVARQAVDALDAQMKGIASQSKWMTYEQGPRDNKVYRFVVDYRP